MKSELLLDLIAYILLPAFVLHLIHPVWFDTYVTTLINVVYIVVSTFAGVIVGLTILIPKLIIGLLKTIATTLLFVTLIAIYLITSIVPFVGGKMYDLKNRIEQSLHTSYIVYHTRKFRGMMVEVVAKNDERDIQFKEPDQYRIELANVKDDAKTRLEMGESTLSLVLGVILIISKFAGIKLFQAYFYGYPVSLLIELCLLAITVSIIYRIGVLEFFSYSADEKFTSIEEMDAALGYQKGIALVDIVQGLTVVVIFVAAVTNVKYDTLRSVLEAKYNENLWITSWLPLAWRRIQEDQAEN